jgi:nicotinamidase-related amidase
VARTQTHRDPHGIVPDRAATALLILDLISDFAFDDGAKVARAALPVAERIAKLKKRARRAGIPAIYVNDALGRWRSDFPGLVRHCRRPGSLGRDVVAAVLPDESDYRIFKPKHSGFYATSLDTILQYLGARAVILTGVSSHQCVLFTANDAYVRDLELVIPRDCISARTPKDTRLALEYFERVLGAQLTPSTRLRFPREKSKPR